MVHKAYLDHHTATRPFHSAVDKMLTLMKEKWEASHSSLDFENAQEMILEALGCEQEGVFHFCSSGAEAINNAYFSYFFERMAQTGQNHIITTQLENASSLLCLQRLEQLGCASKLLMVNKQGQITKEILEKAIRPRTGLVSISWAQGLTGVIHPIADLAEACKEKGIALHVDASLVLGKLYFRLNDLAIDYLTFDGKCIHAPQGTAGLITKKGALHAPLIVGEGAPHLPGVAALAQALVDNARASDHLCLETARLRDKLERSVKKEIGDAVVFFEHVDRLPNCSAMGFPGVSAEALLFLLQRKGVYASIGGGVTQRLSHVLISSGIDSVLAESAISFSLSFETTEEEIDFAITAIVSSVKQLKACSSHIMEERR